VRQIDIGPGYDSWQRAARRLLHAEASPAEVEFHEVTAAPADDTSAEASGEAVVRVPKRFVDLARAVAPHRDPARWQILYAVL